MLEIKKISKIYKTNDIKTHALKDVSINFRKCEFVSILGPSGSGKTTLLNIIGGLDHYTSGDLVINGVSTKKYNDRDWDTYRNHRVGFVFQSYNLIGHQSVLSNVEIALTLSGVSRKERLRRAKRALRAVGLGDHMHKRPNQLSGGQMQRVAIARALVNNPDIVLADEPTGALDSETSRQIMDLLKEVSKDRLVVMVTHNPELAENYSNRIVTLKDGEITGDTNPYIEENEEVVGSKKVKRTSMKLMTALSLSLNNLMTKKGRTFLTAFAGSIGIIGIALILSLSNGVNSYIDKTEKETLASYPLTIEKQTMDFTGMFSNIGKDSIKSVTCNEGSICTTDDITVSPDLTYENSLVKNNLKDFRSAILNNYQNINDYVTDIGYSYDLDINIYSSNYDNDMVKVNPNTFSLTENTNYANNDMVNVTVNTNPSVFKELIESDDLLDGQYDMLSGRMPENYNELVLITDEKGQIPASVMYALNIENRKELEGTIKKVLNKEDVNLDSYNYSYDELVGTTFKLVLNTDYYTKENDMWIDNQDNEEFMKKLLGSSPDLTIVGVAKVSKEATEAESGFVGYKHSLMEHVIEEISKTNIAKEQINNKEYDIITGLPFDDKFNTYDSALENLGVFDLDSPSSINIYPKDYDSKEKILNIISEYNKDKDENDKITYTDYVGTLMSGITTIVNVITYVLIAFVAISLVVSSIMIAIITYISVLERTKEIGILRAVGASKKDISRVFNAEAIIEGFIAGLFGVITTVLLCIPINAIVNSLTKVPKVASLPTEAGIILILISIFLTVIAGLIPSKIASKKDPVEALRSE